MKKVLLLITIIGLCQYAKAQQGFGTSNPSPSSVIDMVATNKGVLMPRVALTSLMIAAPITAPANALTVFNTATAGTTPNNVTPGYYYWSVDTVIPANSKWVRLLDNNTPLVTTHTLSNPVNTITSNVNGVSVTAPAINSNALTATNGNLVSIVNGVATTPAVPILISASNGLTANSGDVKLGGVLTQATVITTDATKTLALAGLQNGLPTDKIVAVDATSGVMKTLKSALPKFFYAPSVVIPTHTSAGVVLSGTQTLDVYALYAQQFGFSDPTTQARSSATSNLPVLPANQLDYFITYFDKNVFQSVSISTAGIISYVVKPTALPTEATFMNIVFKVQD